MPESNNKVPGCVWTVIMLGGAIAVSLGVVIFWILFEFGQWIGRQ